MNHIYTESMEDRKKSAPTEIVEGYVSGVIGEMSFLGGIVNEWGRVETFIFIW